MGKRSTKKRDKGLYTPINQGEGASGRKRSHSLKSILKVRHLQNLATWASEKASIPPLGALFGRRFAACSEVFGIAPDPSIVSCQRCETILQPGLNCTIRIVKNQEKSRRRSKKKLNTTTPPKNNVIYSCHFCSFENAKRGTSKGHMKDICPSILKDTPTHGTGEAVTTPSGDNCSPNLELTPPQAIAPIPEVHEVATTSVKDSCPPNPELTSQPESPTHEVHEVATTSLKDEIAGKYDVTSKEEETYTTEGVENPSTSTPLAHITLLDNRRKRGKSKSKKPDESAATAEKEDDGASSKKRRKKGWTSLKEIAHGNEMERKKSSTNFSVPFSL